jgi:hypothetical protein
LVTGEGRTFDMKEKMTRLVINYTNNVNIYRLKRCRIHLNILEIGLKESLEDLIVY